MQNNTDSKSKLIRLIEGSPDRQISFKSYMAYCLYDEQYGYYHRSTVKIGKDGDFYTSSSVGPMMGRTLAAAIRKLLQQEGWADGPWQIAEWGGGNGRLALHMLDCLRQEAPDPYARLTYTLVERSPYHRTLQRDALREHERVRFQTPEEWLAESSAIPTIVCSNELLDAFPVHRLRYAQGRFEELFVRWDPSRERLEEVYAPITERQLHDAIRAYGLPEREGQLFELNTDAASWIRSVAERLNPGALITIDYGDTADELYGPHRMRGTLMCYRKHQAHDDPYVHIGEQDMTAHVNFSACIQAGIEAGLTQWTLQTQRAFLVENGILDQLQAHDGRDPFSPEARANRAIRQLLLSDQMSELFKVLIQFPTK